jgi:hypothetical protein
MVFILASLTCLTIAKALRLSSGQYLELFMVIGGLTLIGFGLHGFTHEKEAHRNAVSESLWLASAMTLLPLLVAALYWRSNGQISHADEIALFILAVVIVTLGYLLKIKSAALLGGTTLVAHITVLLVTLPFWDLVPVSVYMILVGALLFGGGLILSFKREALLEIPQMYRDGEGLFQIKEWR